MVRNKDSANKSTTCNIINKKDALNIVRNLPEVKEYLKDGRQPVKSQTSEAAVSIDKENKNSWNVHVYSIETYAANLNIPSHEATFNWYSIDKCTGKILCELATYDAKGKFIGVTSDYPCDK